MKLFQKRKRNGEYAWFDLLLRQAEQMQGVNKKRELLRLEDLIRAITEYTGQEVRRKRKNIASEISQTIQELQAVTDQIPEPPNQPEWCRVTVIENQQYSCWGQREPECAGCAFKKEQPKDGDNGK